MDGEHDIPQPHEAVAVVTEPVSDAVEAVQDAADTSIHELSHALQLHGETLRAHGGILDTLVGNTSAILNQINNLAATAAQATVDVPSEAAQTVVELPEEATEKIDAAVENATEEPKAIKRRRRRRR